MKNHRTRMMMLSSATLALIIASTAAVAAAGPRDDDRGFGHGKGRMGMDAKRGMGAAGMRAELRSGLRGALEDFERRETTIQMADGTMSHRVENGVVDGTSATGIDFTLGSGETVTVTVDDDTDVIAFSEETVERGRWSRERMVPSEIELSAIEAGAEVTVWSGSEDDSDFVAQRIVVHPFDETEADTDVTAEESVVEESAAVPATDA